MVEPLVLELAGGVRAALQDRLIGTYLVGSSVLGDFDPATSDLDLIVIHEGEIDVCTFDALQTMHASFEALHGEWSDRVETVYVSQESLAAFRELDHPLVVISPGEPLNRKQGGRDWLVNWYLARQAGRRLFGLDPIDAFPPISDGEFVAAVRESLDGWEEWLEHARHPGALAYATLTLCRTLYTIQTGSQASKRAAAEWFVGRYPDWQEHVLGAVGWRETWTDEPGTLRRWSQARDLLTFVRERAGLAS